MKRIVLLGALFLPLAGCFLPPPDLPAHPAKMGRFLGLVASCRCSNISPERMIAEYPKALAGRYTEAEIKGMRGYVVLGAHEQWDNQPSICADACSRACMVNAVVAPLGGRTTPGVEPCLVSERDLMLETPRASMGQGE